MAGVYSVTEINSYIKNMFIRDFALSKICIKGEVSNLKYHSSGHIYFTLKDENSAINAVMFASKRQGLTFRMQEGQSVEARGQIAVYEKTGTYQLYAREIKLSGRGELYERFEKLKKELLEMGMFDPCYKKPIPRYSLRIGIVTSPTGAAVRDIMNIAFRRNPYVELILYPALVQGEEAKYSIARGIRTLDAMGLDVLIVGRGGGSIEDLWAFNEEMVARAIFDADTPVISAVGHEVDTTISDFAADLRAPTPSAAAELAVFDHEAFMEELDSYSNTLLRLMTLKIEKNRAKLRERKLALSLKSPESIIAEKKRQLSDAKKEMTRLIMERIEDKRYMLESAVSEMNLCMDRGIKDARNRLRLSSRQLELLSPLSRIAGGYGYLMGEDEKGILSVSQVAEGDIIKAYVKDGVITAKTESTEGWDHYGF